MEAQQDFRELLELFNDRKIDFMIVGGFALAFHGAPRFTGELDIFIRSDEENASRIMDALAGFGFGSAGLNKTDFMDPDRVVQLGVPPVRIDLITSISGVTWEEANAGRVFSEFGGVPVSYLGRNEFIKNKKAIGRHKDLADIEALDEI